jgi:uncharacterized protein YbjT (DUF2867 family)
MENVLVIGASGFVGKNLAKQLIKEGYQVRCLARNLAKIQDLAEIGCNLVQGDISDDYSLIKATESIDAIYIAIQTLAAQKAAPSDLNFMDIELNGLKSMVTAGKVNKVKRIIYVTFLGTSPTSKSLWIEGRWRAEQYLINSGIDSTVIRPGLIVGIGGQGFNTALSNAKKGIAIVIGNGKSKMRIISIDDLVYYLVNVLTEPKAFGQCFDVGNDDVITGDERIDTIAEVIGNKKPAKIHIPKFILKAFTPIIGLTGMFSKGSFKTITDSIGLEAVGDPSAIRKLLPKQLLTYRQAIEKAIASHTISN